MSESGNGAGLPSETFATIPRRSWSIFLVIQLGAFLNVDESGFDCGEKTGLYP